MSPVGTTAVYLAGKAAVRRKAGERLHIEEAVLLERIRMAYACEAGRCDLCSAAKCLAILSM